MTVQTDSFLQRNEKFVSNFLAGGVAGCCAKSAVAPFDRVKILLQAHNQHYKHLGVFATVTQVVRTEGALGLYKGNGAQMIRIFPYAAIQFTSYEIYKQKLRQWLGSSHYLVAGSLAGLTAVVFTYPLDVIRARLAFQVAGDEMYRGIKHALHTMATKEGGVRGLYKGIVPTLLGMAPYAGLSFYSFERLKQLCIDYFPHTLCKPAPARNHMSRHPSGGHGQRSQPSQRSSHSLITGLDAQNVTSQVSGCTNVQHQTQRLKSQTMTSQDATPRLFPSRNALEDLSSQDTKSQKSDLQIVGSQKKNLSPQTPGSHDLKSQTFKSQDVTSQVSRLQSRDEPHDEEAQDLILSIPAKLLCGGFAGAFAQTVSYPLDVARRKMQVALLLQAQESVKFSTATWYRTLALVFREHGVRKGLYRGLSINYIKVTPMVAVSFSTYELMKQWLHLDTSGHRS